MREIKFSKEDTNLLYFSDNDFKIKYEEAINDNSNFIQNIKGEEKHLAICPRCNNPVVILGIYQKIDRRPHARHAKGINIPNIATYNEYKYLHCEYHKKRADYVKEYVSKREEPERHEIYIRTKEHYDKVIYLLERTTGIHIDYNFAAKLAENYAAIRAYNYIDATINNIPWYLIYSYHGMPLYHMLIKKNSKIYRQLKSLNFTLIEQKNNYVSVESHKDYAITATNYRYSVDKNDIVNEYLDFSITKPNTKTESGCPAVKVKRFYIKVNSYHFNNLVHYKEWKREERENKLLEIASNYMNP